MPGIAAEFGLKVALGIWIDKNEARNEREIQAAIALARRYRNVNAIVVGNETIYRAEKSSRAHQAHSAGEAAKLRSPSPPAKSGRSGSSIPSSPRPSISSPRISFRTGRAFQRPKWSIRRFEFYDKLRRMHPGKRIVIAEFGWPSAGYNMLRANPGRIEQATVLRDFISRAEAYGIDYNIIEAFDQPWKTNEGSVGMYWGLFDAARQPKFSWVGWCRIPTTGRWRVLRSCSASCFRCRSLREAASTRAEAFTLAVAANAAGAWFAASLRSGRRIISCPAPLSRSGLASRSSSRWSRLRSSASRRSQPSLSGTAPAA